MKSYQSSRQEGIVHEALLNNRELIGQYGRMLDNILDYRTLSRAGLFEACSISKITISKKALIVEVLLRSPILPPFMFLLCSN